MSDNQGVEEPGRLSVEHSEADGIRVVAVRGEIDHEGADILSRALQPFDGAAPPRTVADLSGVSFMDSSGINVFVAAYRTANDAQGWLRIAGAQEPVLRVLQLVGVDALVDCHPTVEQALTA
ncbi:STAS domain-containing protein [Streptomyces sp. NPDC058818]|uniref:STAS domain-containing protein n=1 Tax=Streptomyces sp. NPDC058818 TaxID=3346640 RepID=UPI00369C8C06